MPATENGTLVLDREPTAPLNPKVGDPLSVEKPPGRSHQTEAHKKRPDIMDFAGCFKTDLRLSLEEIEEATARGYLEEELKVSQ